jgi:hypothetical protein
VSPNSFHLSCCQKCFPIDFQPHLFSALVRSSGVIKLIADKHSQLEIEQSYGYYESFYHPDHNQMNANAPQFETSFNVKGNGMCLPGYIDSEGDELPWLLGTAENWQNSGEHLSELRKG